MSDKVQQTLGNPSWARVTAFTMYGLACGGMNIAFWQELLQLKLDAGLVFWGAIVCFLFAGFGFQIAKLKGRTILLSCLLLPFFPVLYLSALLLAMAVGVVWLPIVMTGFSIKGFLQRRRYRQKLRGAGRLTSVTEIRHRLEVGEGTFIMETGFKGTYQIWWTEDDLLAKGTPVKTNEEIFAVWEGKPHEFNELLLKDYLDEDSGKAILTDIPPKKARAGRLARAFPRTPSVLAVHYH
ncbi:MAG TPA: hypothetical protein VE988_17120 [Gemmataceae bacterium]|nr:hypothetical protein [Gemmataceae bacterium]